MAKTSKLFYAFTGDTAGLRNVLVEHLRQEASKITVDSKDASYGNGIEAGRVYAYREIAQFLKKLVINNDEYAAETVNSEDGGLPNHDPR